MGLLLVAARPLLPLLLLLLVLMVLMPMQLLELGLHRLLRGLRLPFPPAAAGGRCRSSRSSVRRGARLSRLSRHS